MAHFRGFSYLHFCAPFRRIPAALIAVPFFIAGSLLTTVAAAGQYSFQSLGDLPGGAFSSAATAVSADGSVVVGLGYATAGGEAFRWTSAGGMVGLGELPGGTYLSEAYAVSADGKVVTGRSTSALNANPAFRWTSSDGMVDLGDLPYGNFFCSANGVSGDGTVVVGAGSSAATLGAPSRSEAFRWTSATGMVGLGDLPGGSFSSKAYAITADGNVIVGGANSSSGFEAFRWTSATGLVGLGDLPGGTFSSTAYAVSADGNVVVGYGRPDSGIDEAFRWTGAGGMVGLGTLRGTTADSYAFGVSADGSVVVGYAHQYGTPGVPETAFFWTKERHIVNLKSFLIANGVTNLDGWSLSRAQTVSADGRTIVGYGTNPSGETEAWVATIPEPSSLVLAVGGLFALAVFARPRGRV
jgi:probable HAF family extracellular repeat protein